MDDPAGPRVVAIGDSVLDLDRGVLRRDGRAVHLRPKSFALLCELARHAGRVLSKDHLVEAAWPGAVATDESLAQAIRDIRRSLGDDTRQMLRTVSGRGFVLQAEPGPAAPGAPAAPAARGPPRIAVLPFRDETGEAGRRPLLDAIAEELTTSLARFHNLAVVSPHSAAAAARLDLDLAETGARLRADYLVEGTVRLIGARLRLTLSLNDVGSGDLLWGDALESADADWIAVWDQASHRIASRLFASVEEAGYRASLRRPAGDLTAFEHLAWGRAMVRSPSPGALRRALEHFAAALAADPCLGLAHAGHAAAELALHDHAMAPAAVRRRARDEAARGVELSPEESGCHAVLGLCEAHLGAFEAAEREARQAVALNPCDADSLIVLAAVLVWRGASEAALPWIARAKDIDPLWPPGYDALHSEAAFFLGRDEEAIALLHRLSDRSARQEMRLAAAYALAGDLGAAGRHAARARSREPGWDFAELAAAAYHRRDDADVRRLVRGIGIALGAAAAG